MEMMPMATSITASTGSATRRAPRRQVSMTDFDDRLRFTCARGPDVIDHEHEITKMCKRRRSQRSERRVETV